MNQTSGTPKPTGRNHGNSDVVGVTVFLISIGGIKEREGNRNKNNSSGGSNTGQACVSDPPRDTGELSSGEGGGGGAGGAGRLVWFSALMNDGTRGPMTTTRDAVT